jgi:alpha-glucosidase (family GH31 glycosyl hydrolase)
MHIQRLSDQRPLLHITHVSPTPHIEQWAYGELWQGVDEIEIELGAVHWYGQGALVHQLLPLEKTAQYAAPFITSDNGATGLLGLLEPLWLTSSGAGVRVENDDFTFSFNAPTTGTPPEHSFVNPAPLHVRPPAAETVSTDGKLKIRGKNLTLRFFACENARAVVEAFWSLLRLPPAPPSYLFEKPLWTTWAQFKMAISQDIVLNYARQIVAHGFGCAILGIDDRWQTAMGDAQFKPDTFPDPQGMIDTLKNLGIETTVWTAPFLEEGGVNFAIGKPHGYFVPNAEGEAFIGTWWGGQAAFIDAGNAAALDWYFSNYQRDIVQRYGLHGLKVDGGEAMFYSRTGMVTSEHPNRLNTRYVEAAARYFPWSDMRSAWRSQDQPMLFRQWDKSSQWGFDNGLASCITQAIQLNLIGYPYSFPDMIGGNLYGTQVATAELLIRWTQAVAPMPIIQFSLAPWDYGDECVRLCARYAQLHGELAARNVALAQQGGLLVRPLWWLDPTDEAALACADEYLVGDDLLVAPVIVAGARERDIYLPRGRWRSYWNAAEIHAGQQWLKAYPAPLDVLPLFERISA